MKRLLLALALAGVLAGCSTGTPVKADILPLITPKAGEYNYIAKASEQGIQDFVNGLYEAGTLEHGKGNDEHIYAIYLNGANQICNDMSRLARVRYKDSDPENAAINARNDIILDIVQSDDKEFKRKYKIVPRLALDHICYEIRLGVFLD